MRQNVPTWNKLTHVRQKYAVGRPEIRYSESFKMAIVRELEGGEMPFEAIRQKYGIGGSGLVQKWASL